MTTKTAQSQRISNNIKRLRDLKGWNQARLAEEAKISGAALSKIEKDGTRIPTIVVLRKLAAALNVPIYEITGEEPEKASEADEKNKEFYRKWDVLEGLSEKDEKLVKEMAERFKEITKK